MNSRRLLPWLKLALILVPAALLLTRCNSTPDTEKPTVHFVQPADGDTFPPGIYTIKAVADDDRGVDFVAFWAYSEMLGLVRYPVARDTYQIDVDCRTDSFPAVPLAVEAVDDARNIARQSITIYIRP